MPTSPPSMSLADSVAARFASPSSVVPEDAASPTIKAMLDHRSCREYLDQPLPDELLDVVLAAAFSTPSKSDLQQCSVIVIDDPTKRNAIADLIPTMPWIAECARFLLFCGDSRRIRHIADRQGTEFANNHLDAVLNAAGDAATHLSSFIWAAESVGLGTCPISVVRNHIEAVSEIVELPNHVFPFAGMCVGWPNRLRHLSPRLPLEVTVHRDRYDDSKAAGLIAEYDQHRHRGFSGEVVWSEEKAGMVARRERDQLADFLTNRGFGLG